ncbi:craniofacial development protein 1 [Chanos chanos]|uniref:Craniofacial development protein 1 n=1 Tax=Chanos chanos TaxID=29144 RepID=A0A6J2UPG3_CHACN|nr:craniofacial development protein 1 [Chanos chanos]
MMNYSDYDSDDYSSNEDEDYVPSDDNLSEDDLNECEKEDALENVDCQSEEKSDNAKKKKKKVRTSKGVGMRKRKKGGLKLEEGAEEDKEKKERDEDDAKEEGCVSVSKEADEEVKRKKEEDLWASFLSDVGRRPKATAAPSTTASQEATSTASSDEPSKAPLEVQQDALKPKESSKITITKVFDFAGEEVRVTKEVDTDSREAQSFLKKEERAAEKQEKTDVSPKPELPQSLTPGPSVKRPGGMSGILSQIGVKKQKMSTLEKSRLDWDAFKTEEGIEDELAIFNRGKGGYVERKNFLERVDQRRFEQEKTARLSNMKR